MVAESPERGPAPGPRALLLLLLAATAGRGAGAADAIVIDPSQALDHWLAAGTSAHLPPADARSPPGAPGGNIGWFEYAFVVREPGWRRLALEGEPSVGRMELAIDPPARAVATTGPDALRAGDWIWLAAGAHRVRIGTTFWAGMPRITGLRLESPGPQDTPFQVPRDRDRPVTALDQCAPITVLAGGAMQPAKIRVSFFHEEASLRGEVLDVPASPLPTRHRIPVPCSRAGDFMAQLAPDVPAQSAAPVTVRYSAVDVRPVTLQWQQGAAIVDIDAYRRPPDFASGATALASSAAGEYRESSRNGTFPYIRNRTTAAPGWFAYRVAGLKPGSPYILELEYPDDAARVFVAAYLDRLDAPFSYPASAGMETGGTWPMSRRTGRRRIIFWPKSADGRVIVFNMFDGLKAAVARIRIYEAASMERPAAPRRDGLRDVAIWYEEGLNFKALAGMNPGEDVHRIATPIDRYLGLVQASGASMVWPSVNVYTFQLYPSRYNLTFNEQDADVTAGFLLGAQRYGLKVVPELHPRADELIWPARSAAEFDARLLRNQTGSQHYDGPDGRALRPPFYNALDADVRRWYVDVVGELAERYKDYPALAGVALRVSDWQNPGLNNLVSSAWGYDAATVARFARDAGTAAQRALAVPGDTLEALRRRQFILTGKYRAEWERWRCEQIRDTLREVVERVRGARSDLSVYLFLFSLGDGLNTPDAAALRGMGIDLALLRTVDGLTVVDGRFPHGTSEPSLAWQSAARAAALGPQGVAIAGDEATRASTLSPMRYLEITPAAAPRSRLGWATPGEEPWISAASEPVGRLRLERYAQQLGLFDVYMLGDGGNGYVFDDRETREFFTAFRTLPRRPFSSVVLDPQRLAVRSSGEMFYLVNLSAVPQSVRVTLERGASVARAIDGEPVELRDQAFVSDLAPFGLAVYRADGPTGRLVVHAQNGPERGAVR